MARRSRQCSYFAGFPSCSLDANREYRDKELTSAASSILKNQQEFMIDQYSALQKDALTWLSELFTFRPAEYMLANV